VCWFLGPVSTWAWPTWVVSRRRVLEDAFILLEFPSPSIRIFIGSHSLPPSLVRRIGPSARRQVGFGEGEGEEEGGGRVGDLIAAAVVSRFRDISGVDEGVGHRDISLAVGPRNEISAGDKMSWAGSGGKWVGGFRISARATTMG
jgi:hypothetical protein